MTESAPPAYTHTMRVYFKIGLVRDVPSPLGTLHAMAGEPDRSVMGRWFAANADLKSIIAAVALGVTLWTVHMQSVAHLTEVRTSTDHDMVQMHDEFAQDERRLAHIEMVMSKLDSSFVSRQEHESVNAERARIEQQRDERLARLERNADFLAQHALTKP